MSTKLEVQARATTYFISLLSF